MHTNKRNLETEFVPTFEDIIRIAQGVLCFLSLADVIELRQTSKSNRECIDEKSITFNSTIKVKHDWVLPSPPSFARSLLDLKKLSLHVRIVFREPVTIENAHYTPTIRNSLVPFISGLIVVNAIYMDSIISANNKQALFSQLKVLELNKIKFDIEQTSDFRCFRNLETLDMYKCWFGDDIMIPDSIKCIKLLECAATMHIAPTSDLDLICVRGSLSVYIEVGPQTNEPFQRAHVKQLNLQSAYFTMSSAVDVDIVNVADFVYFVPDNLCAKFIHIAERRKYHYRFVRFNGRTQATVLDISALKNGSVSSGWISDGSTTITIGQAMAMTNTPSIGQTSIECIAFKINEGVANRNVECKKLCNALIANLPFQCTLEPSIHDNIMLYRRNGHVVSPDTLEFICSVSKQ